MFYEFIQNNSGGSFSGQFKSIIIEADSAEDANRRAESETEIYFDGCIKGLDCDCCGDRWSEQWDEQDGTETPQHYGVEIDSVDWSYLWKMDILILYKDGTKVIITNPEKAA